MSPGGELAGRAVCIAGVGVSGAAAATALLAAGARVTVVDDRDGPREQEAAAALERRGAAVRLGPGATGTLPAGTDLVVTSPGWRPDAPLLAQAVRAGIEVIGEPELAWRIQPEAHRVPWLGVTGTNGKTTTVGMLTAILQAAGHRTAAAGNIGAPLVEAVLADPPYDVIVAELSSFQLHWSSRLDLRVGAVLNLAPDHVDWHGSFEAYAAAKATVFARSGEQLYNADDPATEALLPAGADTCAHGFSLTRLADFCVRDGVLLDRTSGVPAVSPDDAPMLTGPPPPGAVPAALPPADPAEAAAHRAQGGFELASVDDVGLPGPHNLANALAAAGIARLLALDPAYPVPPRAVRDGLRSYRPGAHRNALVVTVDGVGYVDDSKATNPHAAAASLAAYESVVWVAGGLLKGADVDDLVRVHAGRLRGAVLLGRDRDRIAAALARHAPAIPVVDLPATDTGVMATAVQRAAGLARPGDTVLLAPAAASMDIFRDYAERGERFAAAARGLAGERR